MFLHLNSITVLSLSALKLFLQTEKSIEAFSFPTIPQQVKSHNNNVIVKKQAAEKIHHYHHQCQKERITVLNSFTNNNNNPFNNNNNDPFNNNNSNENNNNNQFNNNNDNNNYNNEMFNNNPSSTALNAFGNNNNNPFNNNNENNNPFNNNNNNQMTVDPSSNPFNNNNNDNNFNSQFNDNSYNTDGTNINTNDEVINNDNNNKNTNKKKSSKLKKFLKKLPKDIPTASSILYQTLSLKTDEVTKEEIIANITYYCDSIENKRLAGDEKGIVTISAMKYSRYYLLKVLLQKDYVAYVETATFFNNRIPRNELPNVQDIPYLELDPYMSIYGTMYNEDGTTEDEEGFGEGYIPLLPDCSLSNITFIDSILDNTLIYIFRKLVEKNSDFVAISDENGIAGLLEQGRKYMLSGASEERQHEMVQDTLRDLMSPITPIYRLFMSGIIPSLPKYISDYIDDDFQEADNKIPYALKSNFDKNRYNFLDFGKVNDENDDENNNNKRNRKKEGFDDKDDRIENQFGPLFYAPYFTSVVTPPFFKFLVGPSKPNLRKDGKAGGLLVEKCKFLQESNCKGLCLHQCKIPAQQFFKENLGMDLTVSPNFVTQECQWSFGEKPLPPEDDPSFPKGCLVGCPSRSYAMQMEDEESEESIAMQMQSSCG